MQRIRFRGRFVKNPSDATDALHETTAGTMISADEASGREAVKRPVDAGVPKDGVSTSLDGPASKRQTTESSVFSNFMALPESEDPSVESTSEVPLSGNKQKKTRTEMPWNCIRPLWDSKGRLISLQEVGKDPTNVNSDESGAEAVGQAPGTTGNDGLPNSENSPSATTSCLPSSDLTQLENHLPSSVEPAEQLPPVVITPRTARPTIIRRLIQGSAMTNAYGPAVTDVQKAAQIIRKDVTLALSVQCALGMEVKEADPSGPSDKDLKSALRGLKRKLKRKEQKIKQLLDNEQALKAQVDAADLRIDPETLPPILRELVELNAMDPPSTRRYSSEMMDFCCKMYKHSKKSLVTGKAHGLPFPSLSQVSKRVKLKKLTEPVGGEKRILVRFTPAQQDALSQAYAISKFPPREDVEKLAEEIDVPFAKVRKWFHQQIYYERCKGTLPWTDKKDTH